MSEKLNQPLSGNEMPRFGGIATMMRLPHQVSAKGLDACFVGAPFDLGTSMRSGARFGPLVRIPIFMRNSFCQDN